MDVNTLAARIAAMQYVLITIVAHLEDRNAVLAQLEHDAELASVTMLYSETATDETKALMEREIAFLLQSLRQAAATGPRRST